jgi:orotidine-5'-phosphate decarboxylase
MDEKNLKKTGVNDNMETQVLRLAKLAKEAGLDGVVASASEVKLIRKNIGGDFLIVTPGVRPSWAAANDQKRVTTPKEAIESGSDFIVVGRPIIEAPDPVSAAKKVLEEIAK